DWFQGVSLVRKRMPYALPEMPTYQPVAPKAPQPFGPGGEVPCINITTIQKRKVGANLAEAGNNNNVKKIAQDSTNPHKTNAPTPLIRAVEQYFIPLLVSVAQLGGAGTSNHTVGVM